MEATQKQYYKYCIVPLCPSTTFKTPDKLFIRVPQDKSRRLKWLKACRRNEEDISEKTTAHVCEDHFNLEEDMDNYVKFKLMGGLKKMKANIVPHIFDCQPDRQISYTNHPRAAAAKRTKNFSKRKTFGVFYTSVENEDLGSTSQQSEGNDDTEAVHAKYPQTSTLFQQTSRRRKHSPELCEEESQTKEAFSMLRKVVIINNDEKEDECELFGKILAKKLRKLPELQRDLLMHDIDGMVLNAIHRTDVCGSVSRCYSSELPSHSSPISPSVSRPTSANTNYICASPVEFKEELP